MSEIAVLRELAERYAQASSTLDYPAYVRIERSLLITASSVTSRYLGLHLPNFSFGARSAVERAITSTPIPAIAIRCIRDAFEISAAVASFHSANPYQRKDFDAGSNRARDWQDIMSRRLRSYAETLAALEAHGDR